MPRDNSGGLVCAVLRASIMRHQAETFTMMRDFTDLASKLPCMQERVAGSLTRYRPKWQTMWRIWNANFLAGMSPSPIHVDINADGSIINGCVTNLRPLDSCRHPVFNVYAPSVLGSIVQRKLTPKIFPRSSTWSTASWIFKSVVNKLLPRFSGPSHAMISPLARKVTTPSSRCRGVRKYVSP